MPEKFKSIADILNENPGLAPVRKIIKQSDVIIGFYDIFPELRKVVKPVKVDKQILFIKVENSILRSELRFQENLIVSKVNKYFKEERIKGIKFQ
ncbi:MAG TPA: DciA family protein [Ignavibacteriaceae bacterium]|nr:DciA family protein [Ignavibacteriaceae bacterium]